MKEKQIIMRLWIGFVALLLVACGPASPGPNTPEDREPAVDVSTEEDTSSEEMAEETADDEMEEETSQNVEETSSEATEEASSEETTTDTSSESEESESAEPLGELEYIEIEAGSGPAPQAGDTVRVHYTGSLEDGTVFDSSIDRGEPWAFVLGEGNVIPGWDQGIAMMNEGGKATLIIPPHLAYGEQGAGGVIPPNATLTFEVELVAVIPPVPPTEVDEADYETTDSGLQYYDFEVGEGEPPQAGDTVVLHFTAWLQEGNKKLSSSYDQGQPVSFPLGTGDVLPGWDEGISTMLVGGKRQLVLPPDLAFGEAGSGDVIPPNAVLIFEVELVDVIRLPEPAVFPEIDESEYETTESGLKYYDIEVGDGETPEVGQQVDVHYTGWLLDGTQFDSSIDRGQPFSFILGTGGVIAGWDEGVATMNVGGTRLLLIPADLAYGETGSGTSIPPNSDLIFEVHLLAIR